MFFFSISSYACIHLFVCVFIYGNAMGSFVDVRCPSFFAELLTMLGESTSITPYLKFTCAPPVPCRCPIYHCDVQVHFMLGALPKIHSNKSLVSSRCSSIFPSIFPKQSIDPWFPGEFPLNTHGFTRIGPGFDSISNPRRAPLNRGARGLGTQARDGRGWEESFHGIFEWGSQGFHGI